LLLRLAALSAAALGCAGGHAVDTEVAFFAEASLPDTPIDAAPDAIALDASDGATEANEAGPLVVLPAQFTEESTPMRMLAEGDPVDLWSAPQGGHVVLVGAKVRNMPSDTANLKVRFRRPDTGFIVAEEGRTVKMVPVPDEPGAMEPDLRTRSQVSNVPLCPSYGSLGIVDEAFLMEVEVTALYADPPPSGRATVHVVARCSAPSDEAFCRCDCGADYSLGKCWDARPPSPDGAPNEDAAPGD
jgi:hypothetical protein